MSKDDPHTESKWVMNTGDNWSTYKWTTNAYCRKYKYQGLLDGTLKKPHYLRPFSTSASSTGVEEAELKYQKELDDYNTKSGNLWYYLVCTHTDITRVHIMDPEIGEDCTKAWHALCNHFESKTKASLKQLAREFISAEQGSDPPHKFFQYVDEKAARLQAGLTERDIEFTDLMKQMIYVDGLHSRYQSIKDQLFHDNTVSDSISLKTTLLERIQREDINNNIKTGVAMSLTASGKKYCKVPHGQA